MKYRHEHILDRTNENGALKRFRELFKKKREKYVNGNVGMAAKTSGSAGITQQLGGDHFRV
jgi:hypothetical protein